MVNPAPPPLVEPRIAFNEEDPPTAKLDDRGI
jgi:hypothetical protein